MAGPWDLTNQNIEDTYQRVVQTPDGINYYDGTGSLLPLSSSFLSGASAVGSTITFTRGDGSTFPVTVGAGTGVPGGSNQTLQFNSASVFSGSNNLKFDYTTNNIILTGSLLVTQSYISSVDYIDFQLLDLTQRPAQNEGRLFWNSDAKTLQLDLEQNFHTDLNQQLILRVVNKTNTNLPIGTVVYISGSQGNRPGIATASWTGDQTSAATLGFTAKAINNNNNGYVITRGILDGVNTNSYPPGTQLYLSSSGQYTNIPPDAPLHEVRLGKVVVQDATVGSIYVDIMNGYELTELHDVKTNGVTNGDLLMYSSSLWINSKTLTGSYTLSGSLTTNDRISVQSLTASFISASSITGSLFGTASWATYALTASYVSGAIGATPGGNNTNIQFNSNGNFGGSNNFTFYRSGTSDNFYNIKLMNGSPDPNPDTEGTETGLRLEDASTKGYTNTFTTTVECAAGNTETIFSLETANNTLGATCNYTILDPNDFSSIRTGQLFVSFVGDGSTFYSSEANNKGGNNASGPSGLALFSFDYNGTLGRVRLINSSVVTLKIIMNVTSFTSV